MATSTDRPAGADEVEIILQRAAPGEVEKEELVEEVGLGTDELREAITWLEDQGTLVSTDSGYRYAEGESLPAEEAGEEEAAELEVTDLLAEESPGPAMAAHVRARYAVGCSFARKPGESDDAAVTKAQTIAGEIGNVLAAAMPSLSFHVEVTAVDAFDHPRSLFPAPDEH